jgi:cystathionine beta-lyase
LEAAVAELEGGAGAMVVPSGLSAAAVALFACVRSGDHVLMADSVYGPTRGFCRSILSRFGVETTFYDPLLGGGIAALMHPNTRVVFCESPGSLTFEVQDIPAIAAAAHAAGALVLMDNTWATPLLFRAFDHGVDISIHAATKYIAGHSDAMLGLVVCNSATHERVRTTWADLGLTAGPDDVYLGLRGLRTLDARLERHQRSAIEIANWLCQQSEVAEVIYPALPGARGHELWRRDFKGASGLFTVILKPAPKAAVDALLDGMRLFKMGWSWGGFESLILPIHPETTRSATTWVPGGPCLRLHIGLEDPRDLTADLRAGLARLGENRR